MDELLQFLSSSTRPDLKRQSSAAVSKLTGTTDGLATVISRGNEFGNVLLELIEDKDDVTAENAFKALTNISAEENGCSVLHNVEKDILTKLIKCIQDSESRNADLACGILSNFTHPAEECGAVLEYFQKVPDELEKLIFIFCKPKYNKKGATLNLLGSAISNLTQLSDGRKLLLNKERCIFERLLPFITYQYSGVRRNAAVAAVHNCCFETEFHEWLLSEDIDIASRLALPLAGPDCYSVEENESLPVDLQFLPSDKMREEDPNIRVLLLESFMQLCATRRGRNILRKLNIYLILREHHKWEQNEKCIQLNEDVVNLLIKTEEEIGEDDLTSLELPPDLVKKFTDSDAAASELQEKDLQNELKL